MGWYPVLVAGSWGHLDPEVVMYFSHDWHFAGAPQREKIAP
jgi:hypothetical protein